MSVDEAILSARFGLGPEPLGAEALLAPLDSPDGMARRYPIAPYSEIAPIWEDIRTLNRARRDATAERETELNQKRRALMRAQAQRRERDIAHLLARASDTSDPMRERLTWFWADHFTVVGKHAFLRTAIQSYVDEAIRPHITGRFADLLHAAILHTMMVIYLDQASSVGPNSKFGRNRPKRGLNENLAREVMELHTLGVGSAYTQDDVRQLAELLAGLSVRPTGELWFAPQRGEPGPERILGRRYGRRAPKLADIHQVLDDLAHHPDTARHIATKLATHFVSETPDPALVDHVAARFRYTDGDLTATYAALIEHPAARITERAKAKPPWDFVATSLRALGLSGQTLARLRGQDIRRHVVHPLTRMGQPWEKPAGPDGWPEAADQWITPQGLAGRMTWAMTLPDALQKLDQPIPDPRDFVETALGPLASDTLHFAARAAETREDGVALVLLSPEFQRR